jgi:plasmid stability protein
MKNITITLPDDLAQRARVEAARQDKSLSRFVADMLAERCRADRPTHEEALAVLKEFWDGPGYPGISKVWKGRDALYAEREDKLLRRHQSTGVQSRSSDAGKAERGRGFAEKSRRYRRPGAKSAKPK